VRGQTGELIYCGYDINELAGNVSYEEVVHLRVAHRFARRIFQQVLLRYIGDVFGLVVLGEQMVEGLVLARPDFLRNGLIPFLRVREFGIDVENDAAEREQPVAHHLPDPETRRLQCACHCQLLETYVAQWSVQFNPAGRSEPRLTRPHGSG
jgi:hypothetical protein